MDDLPIRIRPSKLLIYGAIGGGLFLLFLTAYLVLCVKDEAPLPLRLLPLCPAMAFFVLGIIAHRSAPIIELHADGLIIQPHKKKIPWGDITKVTSARIGFRREKHLNFCVCVREDSPHKPPRKVGLDKVLMDAAGAVYDYNAAGFMLDMHPHKIVELAEMLRSRHASATENNVAM